MARAAWERLASSVSGLRSIGVRREIERRALSAPRPRPRSAAMMRSWSHPAWQCTSTLLSSASLIERLGVRSSCAGQRAVQPPPAFRPPRALAIAPARPLSPADRVIRADSNLTRQSRLGAAADPRLFRDPSLKIIQKIEHAPALHEPGTRAGRAHDRQGLRTQAQESRGVFRIKAAVREHDHLPPLKLDAHRRISNNGTG